VALVQYDSHPTRITLDYNFLLSMIDEVCRRVTLLLTNCSYGVLIMPWDLRRVLEKTALRVLTAGAMLLISPLAALASDTNIHPGFAGIYVARVDKKAPSMTVSLGVDGTATVTEDPGTGSITSFGHWANDGSQIKVTFKADEGEPAAPPMVFQVVHNKLQPVTWNHEAWGNAHPPTMEKGYKVKYLFWSTTMP
jgi:hypothetical protein